MGSLWRHNDFLRLWAGETVEWLSDSVTSLAVPTIAILTFNAGPIEMGVLNALGYVAYPILGLFAGVMVDRWTRRPVLVWTNIIQTIALGSIPIAFLLGILSLYQLYAVALVMSVTTVFFSVAYYAYLPTLIDREDLVEGNSKLETSRSGSSVVSPLIAGGLIQWLGAAPSIAVDSICTLFAGIAILSIKKREPPPKRSTQRRFFGELKDGLRAVAGSPTLLSLAATTSVLNIGYSMFIAVFFLFVYDQLKISPGVAGIILGAGGIGFVVGAVTAPRLLKIMGLGPVLTLSLLIYGIGLLLVPAARFGPASIVLAVLWMLTNMGIPIYNINQVSFRQTIVPDNLQGRMNATMRTFGFTAYTIGALLGGIIGNLYGILTTMTLGAIVVLLSAFLLGLGPLGRLRKIPQTEL